MKQKQQTVFIETSVQIQRLLAPPAQKAKLEKALTASAIMPVTSAYVWMEYQRTVIADYAHVHSVMGRDIQDGERCLSTF